MENLTNNLRKIKNDFAIIGARVQVVPYSSGEGIFSQGVAEVNVAEDMSGEFFEITISRDIIGNLKVVYIDREENKLILSASTEVQFVCGARNRDLSIEYKYKPDSKKRTRTMGYIPMAASSSGNMTGIYGVKALIGRKEIN